MFVRNIENVLINDQKLNKFSLLKYGLYDQHGSSLSFKERRIQQRKGFRSIMQTYFILLCLLFMSLFSCAMKGDRDSNLDALVSDDDGL